MNSIGSILQNNEDVSFISNNPFPSFNKFIFSFSSNIKVNLDFETYLNLLNDKSNTSRLKIIRLIENLNNNKLIFYTKDDYDKLNSAISSFLKIKRFINNLYNFKCHNREYVNDTSLLFIPFEEISNVIELPIESKIYRYSISDIVQIYNHSIKHIDEKAYIQGELEIPKNPYTGVEFTFKENLIIFEQLKKYYASSGKLMPSFLNNFKECYFDIDKYYNKYYNFIMNVSVSNYVDNLNNNAFIDEFDEMISSSLSIEDYYCKKCYDRVNVKDIFSDAVKLYILNSNSIYVYGLYEEKFRNIAQANDLYFDANHNNNRHRRRYRARRTILRNTRRRNSIYSSTGFLFNTDNIYFSQDNIISFNFGNTGFSTDLYTSNSNSNNTFISNGINVSNITPFTFNFGDLTPIANVINIDSNITDNNNPPLTIRIPNIESEGSLSNNPADYQMNLTNSISSLDTPTNYFSQSP